MSLCPSCCVSSLSASLATSHHRSGRDTHTWTRTLISKQAHTHQPSLQWNDYQLWKEKREKKLFMIFWTEILPAGIKWWKAGRERSQTVYYCKARLTFQLESLNYRRKVIQLTTTELKHWLWEHIRQHLANASEPSLYFMAQIQHTAGNIPDSCCIHDVYRILKLLYWIRFIITNKPVWDWAIGRWVRCGLALT